MHAPISLLFGISHDYLDFEVQPNALIVYVTNLGDVVNTIGAVRAHANWCLGQSLGRDGEADGLHCCPRCLAVVTKRSFREVLGNHHRAAQHGKNARSRADFSSNAELARRAADLKARESLSRLKVDLYQNKYLKHKTHLEYIKRHVLTDDAAALVHTYNYVAKHGEPKEIAMALESVECILYNAANAVKDKCSNGGQRKAVHGNVSTERTRAMATALKIKGGSKCVDMFAKNGLGTSIKTARRFDAKRSRTFSIDGNMPEVNFANAAADYSLALATLIERGELVPGTKILCELSEDESPCEKGADLCTHDWPDDFVAGTCGERGERHKCAFDHRVLSGVDPENTYVHVAANAVSGHYLRAVVVNPLDKRLPKRVVYLGQTCNRFDGNPQVLDQWRLARSHWRKHLQPLNLVLKGNGSDCDARRAMLILWEGLQLGLGRYEVHSNSEAVWTLNAQGFDKKCAWHVKFEQGTEAVLEIRGGGSLDPRHVVKSADGIVKGSKDCWCGKHAICAELLGTLVSQQPDGTVLGLIRTEDDQRTDRQNFRAVVRRTQERVCVALESVHIAEDTQGLVLYYRTLQRYIKAHFSQKCVGAVQFELNGGQFDSVRPPTRVPAYERMHARGWSVRADELTESSK